MDGLQGARGAPRIEEIEVSEVVQRGERLAIFQREGHDVMAQSTGKAVNGSF